MCYCGSVILAGSGTQTMIQDFDMMGAASKYTHLM